MMRASTRGIESQPFEKFKVIAQSVSRCIEVEIPAKVNHLFRSKLNHPFRSKVNHVFRSKVNHLLSMI
jgi:hypothetical protein